MEGKKIVIIGAGSAQFGGQMVTDLLQETELRGRHMAIWLVDTNPKALDHMRRFAEIVKAHTGSDMAIHATTDRCEALPGAAYILTAVAVHRMELWEQDFRVPLSYGFRHVLGENGGPGAVFHALRSLNLIIPICRDIERLCPDALLLNFTNPESRVLNAILRLTKVKAFGLCHGIGSTINFISKYLSIASEDFEITSAGINHLYFVLKVIDRRTGEDLLPGILERIKRDDALPMSLWKRFIEVFDWFSYPSDTHIGEYAAYGAEYHGIKWDYGRESKKIDTPGTLEGHPHSTGGKLARYLDGAPLDPKILRRSNEEAAPIICDIELDRERRHDAVNTLNTEGYIENLPRDGCIEVPGMCDGRGIRPLKVGPIPEGPAAIMRTQLAIHRCVTEAYRTGDKNLLLQALMLDPVVNSIENAKRLLDDMLERQAEYLPRFA